ncbi:hypothetical protein E2C01_047366 [Portunus trituberculatus]|uniref:Secreted protein n=1 Tax=Portunus trituberculatus TaxID=210409 RepID=A0A5B7G3D6_PORTR|nr:hypothetical protein [Portunus trituberculatus]
MFYDVVHFLLRLHYQVLGASTCYASTPQHNIDPLYVHTSIQSPRNISAQPHTNAHLILDLPSILAPCPCRPLKPANISLHGLLAFTSRFTFTRGSRCLTHPARSCVLL